MNPTKTHKIKKVTFVVGEPPLNIFYITKYSVKYSVNYITKYFAIINIEQKQAI